MQRRLSLAEKGRALVTKERLKAVCRLVIGEGYLQDRDIVVIQGKLNHSESRGNTSVQEATYTS